MKKIVVFGANGGIGKYLVAHALENNFEVTAIVRNPATLEIEHTNLTIVKGDILKPETYTEAIKGATAVVSAIGTRDIKKPTTIFSQGVSNIISAMKTSEVERIICISASGIEVSPKLNFVLRFMVKNVLQKILRHPYNDMRKMEEVLRESNLNWTAVRPPRLTNKAFTGKYRYAANAFLDNCLSISRTDVAHFIIQNIDNPKTYQATVEVAN